MVRNEEDTSIPLKKPTRAKLGNLGSKGESWDGLINRVIDERFTYLELNAIVTLICHHKHGGFKIDENIERHLDSVSRKIGESAKEWLENMLKE